ncbi:hypothetical protein D2T29_12685 [Sinirhodobacter populi]|uniref:Uncharacterized protein n=1 Tax=Paenirhodobacter populi TaxID=2306993 RepID=A0A443KCI8_9RHOB|nr:hypothetical protein [Sinirhodobacter populi]RWR30521.1 hypothetical protein D2T29_12685 [Sinirhodobacter populi]
MSKPKLNLVDQLRLHGTWANSDMRLGDQGAFEKAASEIEALQQRIAELEQDLQTTADALGHANAALAHATSRPDPLGDALNSGDGSYRP